MLKYDSINIKDRKCMHLVIFSLNAQEQQICFNQAEHTLRAGENK